MESQLSMNTALLEQDLHGAAKDVHVLAFPSLVSTNATAKQMASEGAQNGTVVIAKHQSAGRGRMNRSFFSPDGTGLYMSLIVRRAMPASYATRLTTAAAVAVAQAIEKMSGRTAHIKWVNDIYLDGKKVCGILTEGSILPGESTLAFAVVGIGVNILPPHGGFPADIVNVATALFADGQAPSGAHEHLAAAILNRLMEYLDELDASAILEEYRRRCAVLGKQIYVHRGDAAPRRAQALDVDDEFRLRVRYEDGCEAALDSGEVSVRSSI